MLRFIRRGSLFREWQLLLIVVIGFIMVAFFTYTFLPDLGFSREVLITSHADSSRAGVDSHGLDVDPHKVMDKVNLYSNIEADKLRQLAIRKLKDRLTLDEKEIIRLRSEINKQKDVLKQITAASTYSTLLEQKRNINRTNLEGAPLNKTILFRRNIVRGMMKLAWDSYVRYAMGQNELRPLSRTGHTSTIFGSRPIGATIVDALDTLHIMDLHDEFDNAKNWIKSSFNFDQDTEVSLFEVNIRFIGGFLSGYYLTGDRMFVDKAVQVADRVLPAFNTATGLPMALIHLKSKSTRNYNWASGSSSILSEVGTLHMEFAALTELTGNQVYLQKVQKIRDILQKATKPNGMYPNYINPHNGAWGQIHASLAGLGDSFYEYLLKEYLRSGKKDVQAMNMYLETLPGIEKNMVRRNDEGLHFLGDYKYNRVERKMDHLGCFAGGMFALGAKELPQNDQSSKWKTLGAEITRTCRESYDRSATKLGPESFHFEGGAQAVAIRMNEKVYILRPETVESYFYLWRLTKEERYRDWAWDVVQALQTHCRTPDGYSGIRDVYSTSPGKDDVQQSFFLAETLKYLYLIFSEDSLLPLDQWVFNTEAHPFPIQGTPAATPRVS